MSARASLTPRTVRLTFQGPALTQLSAEPAQDVALILDDEDGRRVKRRYTIRNARPESGEIDVDMLIHGGGGPGSRWARDAEVGEPVRFGEPRGKVELRHADWHLFLGDEAALPAVAALTEALGPTGVTIVLAEVGSDADRLPLDASTTRWIDRGARPPGSPELLAHALADLGPLSGTGQAYVLGESRAVSALREPLRRLGLSADRAYVKGYWNLERPGRHRSLHHDASGRG